MATSPVKGAIIKSKDNSANSKAYDDILGKFREDLVEKAQKTIQYHKDNVVKGNKPFLGVGVKDEVNTDPGEGTWVFTGANDSDTMFEGRKYDLYYRGWPINNGPTDTRIPLGRVFNKKEIEFRQYTLKGNGNDNYYGMPKIGEGNGESSIAAGQVIKGEKSVYEIWHKNENTGRINGYGPPVEEGEFGQSAGSSVWRELGYFMHTICAVRKAQFYNRMAELNWQKPFPTTVEYMGNNVNINQNNEKNMKKFVRKYSYKKTDGFQGWGTFNPIYFSSTDNNAWEIFKRITNGDVVAGERTKPGFKKNINGVSVEAEGQTIVEDPAASDIRPGVAQPNGTTNANYPSYPGDKNGKLITADAVRTVFQRLEDLWKNYGTANGRDIWVTLDYCHTSCHANCHTTSNPYIRNDHT